MSADKVQALVNYYAREGHSRHIQTVCNEVLRKRPNDPLLTFWRAFGLLLEGSYSETLRELASVMGDDEMRLACMACMIQAHQAAKIVDDEAVLDLQAKMEAEESTATTSAYVQLATFYWHSGMAERARGILERILRSHPDALDAKCVLGWIILSQQAEDDGIEDYATTEEAAQCFDGVLSQVPHHLEAMLGKAKCLEVDKDWANAMEGLNQVVARNPWFVPALVDKAKLMLAMNDWENALDTLGRVLQSDATNTDALLIQAVSTVIREGNVANAVKKIQELHELLDKEEPKNHKLYHQAASILSRCSGGDPQLLKASMQLADKAVRLKPEAAAYHAEVGYHQQLLGDYELALQKFSEARDLDDLNMAPLYGTINCQLYAGQLDDAADQIEFLTEIASSTGLTSELTFMRALLSWKRGEHHKQSAELLEVALKEQMEALRGRPQSLGFLVELNPARMLDMAKLFIQHVGGEPRSSTEPVNEYLLKCQKTLEFLTKFCPGLLEAQVQLARCAYLGGNMDAAQRKASDCLRLSQGCSDAHLLIAHIFLLQGKAQAALNSLESAMSHDFSIKESPQYVIISARAAIMEKRLEEASKVLEAGMKLPGIKQPMTAAQRKKSTPSGGRTKEPLLHERVSIYLLMAECMSKQSRLTDAPEATKIINDALNEFKGTPEEVRVTIANCELALARKDIEGGLKMLRVIPRESPHYIRAKVAMADIYLKHHHDKQAYAQCYMELVELRPDSQTNIMLGEAFMQIQDPEQAVRAFETALEKDPKNIELTTKIGKALVTTHDYKRALEYLVQAVKNNPRNLQLQMELAKLNFKLKQFEQSERVINAILNRQRTGDPIDTLMMDVKALQLQAKVYKGAGNHEAYMETLQRARSTQSGLLGKLRGEHPDTINEQKIVAADMCCELAEEHELRREWESAMEFYNEALKCYDQHAKAMLALAKLYMADGDVDACQNQCVTLLRTYPENEEASVMLAELMFHKEHYETAIYHFQQLLERRPDHYQALSQLVSLLRRAGRLEDIPKFIKAAQKASPRALMDPGLHFCKGLEARYANDVQLAIKENNMARKDTEWGAQAIFQMVELYLNPDHEAVWDEANEGRSNRDNSNAVDAAVTLLREVRGSAARSIKFKVLEAYTQMATGNKSTVEEALSALLDIANQDRDNVPVLLAMATGFMMIKQTPKARNQLKRVQKIQYKPDEAEEFERSWLLLADIHIKSGKYDLAHDLCKKCLKYNKSCGKAWEYMGQIMEREAAYRDAAENYENAWKFESEASAAVGFKLAFNYLKARRFVEAIDVCHKVLAASPDYPKIKKEILEKARASIRP